MARNEAALLTSAGTPSLHRKHRRPLDGFLGALIVFCAVLTVAVLVGLIGYILVNGLPHISWDFLTGTYSARDESRRGILPMLINTLYIVVITLVIVTPIGLSTAVYLTQYARPWSSLRASRRSSTAFSG